MRQQLIIGALIGVLLGILLASIITLFKKDRLDIQKDELQSFRVEGSITTPFYITQEMIDKIRGIEKQVDKTNILNNWKLIGTFVSSDSAAMFANGNNVAVIGVGQELDGYKLVAIDAMFTEFLDKSDKKIVVFMDIAYTPPNAQAEDLTQDMNQGIPDEQNFKMVKLSVDKYLKNPEELLKHVSVIPKLNGGVFEGVLVNGLTQYSFLYNFGVRKGDVIVSINGKRLNSVNDAVAEYQKILNMREFEVTIIRNNSEKVLRYEVIN